MSYWTEDDKNNICAGNLKRITGRVADGVSVFTISKDDESKLAVAGYSQLKDGMVLYP